MKLIILAALAAGIPLAVLLNSIGITLDKVKEGIKGIKDAKKYWSYVKKIVNHYENLEELEKVLADISLSNVTSDEGNTYQGDTESLDEFVMVTHVTADKQDGKATLEFHIDIAEHESSVDCMDVGDCDCWFETDCIVVDSWFDTDCMDVSECFYDALEEQ